MHVAIWERGQQAVAFGPFPEPEDVDGWLFPLGVLLDGTGSRAGAAWVGPAYTWPETDPVPVNIDPTQAQFRTTDASTPADVDAYGFITRIHINDDHTFHYGVFRARPDAAAWIHARLRVGNDDAQATAQIIPLLPVPVTLDGLTHAFAPLP